MDRETLCKKLARLKFSKPVTHVYNPLDYARQPFEQYWERYGQSPKKAVLLGMNPGPWGMAQTGVPFGEIAHVRDWLGIEAPVGKPPKEHPKRPILGFECSRSEVSGARLWGYFKARFERPELFFQKFFVHNYCPLIFLEESGRNRTPDKLKRAERDRLFKICDQHLREAVKALAPEIVIGIGHFAETRARQALGELDLTYGRLLHPSPASPAANRGWAEQAELQLTELGLLAG